MTPSRGRPHALAFAAASAAPTGGARLSLLVLVSLIAGAARGFLFAGPPSAGIVRRQGVGSCCSGAMERTATSPIAARESGRSGSSSSSGGGGGGGGCGMGLCRMTATEGTEEAGEEPREEEVVEEEGDGGNVEADVGGAGDAEGSEGESAATAAAASPEAAAAADEGEGEDEEKPSEEPKKGMPEWLTLTREELEERFPNPPKAPYPVLPDPRDMTPEQLAAAANQDVSYGGQPAARRAIIDFERSERERIHFETATRVINYEIAAERAEAQEKTATLSRAEAKRLKISALNKEFYGQMDPMEDEFAVMVDYKWDKKPELITFSAYGVLYNWYLPIGILMREALGRSHDYVHRMPPPGAFEKHFKAVHDEASFHMPCYGAHINISSWDWWFHVFCTAYLNTINEFYMEEELVLEKIDDLVDELYYEIMVGPEAFEVMPLVKVVLDRLASWRDTNGGPRLAVVAEDDERLHVVLENLGLLPYFDFVLTSRETGYELRDTGMYEIALETAHVSHPSKGLHVGASYESDIRGSCEAGMEAVRVKRLQSMYERKDEPYEFHRICEIGELLHRLGLPEAVEEYMGRRRGKFWEEEEDEDDEDYIQEIYTGEEGIQQQLIE